jgi:hypothetical protein
LSDENQLVNDISEKLSSSSNLMSDFLGFMISLAFLITGPPERLEEETGISHRFPNSKIAQVDCKKYSSFKITRQNLARPLPRPALNLRPKAIEL